MTRRTGWTPETNEDVDNSATSSTSSNDKEDADSTADLLRRVVTQASDYMETEAERQKLRIKILGAAGRDAAIFVVVALFLLGSALAALLVGGIWALAPHLGPVVATLAVIGGTIVLIILLLIAARARMRSAVQLAFGKDKKT